MTLPVLHPTDPLDGDLPGTSGDYEYRVVVFPRSFSRAQVQRFLAEHADRGHWEVARVRMYWGGVRRVWVRRRIIRVVRTA